MKKDTGKKILLVDDDEDILDSVSAVLEMEGYRVAKTTRHAEVFEMIKVFVPNLVVLDILLSGADGRMICRSMKDNETTRHIPVIMMSALQDLAKDSSACGAEGHLYKPFDLEQLISTIDKVINTTN